MAWRPHFARLSLPTFKYSLLFFPLCNSKWSVSLYPAIGKNIQTASAIYSLLHPSREMSRKRAEYQRGIGWNIKSSLALKCSESTVHSHGIKINTLDTRGPEEENPTISLSNEVEPYVVSLQVSTLRQSRLMSKTELWALFQSSQTGSLLENDTLKSIFCSVSVCALERGKH